MKNKFFKFILVAFALGLCSDNLFAQGTYLQFNVGYGLGLGSQTISNSTSANSGSGTTGTDEAVSLSFGKGVSAGGAIGYMFNNNLGAELGISYLFGGKTETKDVTVTTSGNSTRINTYSSKMVRINPSIVVAAGFDRINPYAKFGIIIGSGSILFESNENNDGDIDVTNIKFSGGLALGISSAFGIKFNVKEKLTFFTELNTINLDYAPTKGELILATYNGVDLLPAMKTKDKQIEFVDTYNYSSSNPTPDSEPTKMLKEKMPFGSFGVNLGLILNF